MAVDSSSVVISIVGNSNESNLILNSSSSNVNDENSLDMAFKHATDTHLEVLDISVAVINTSINSIVLRNNAQDASLVQLLLADTSFATKLQVDLINALDLSQNADIITLKAKDTSLDTKVDGLNTALFLDKTQLADFKKLDTILDRTAIGELLPNQYDLEKSSTKLEELVTLFIEQPTTMRTFSLPPSSWICNVKLSCSRYLPDVKVSVNELTTNKLIEHIIGLYGYGIATSNICSPVGEDTSWYKMNAAFKSTPEMTNQMIDTGNAVLTYNNICDRLITFLKSPYKNNIPATDLSQNDRFYVDNNHNLGLITLASLSKNHYECYNDPNTRFRIGFYFGEYTPTEHLKTAIVHSRQYTDLGFMFFPSLNISTNNSFMNKEDILRWPQQMNILNLTIAKMLDESEKGVNDYFIWSGLYPGTKYGTKGVYEVNGSGFTPDPSGTNTFNPKQYTTGDIEGHKLNPLINVATWSDANFSTTDYLAFYEPIEEYVTRTGLSETTYLGINRPADTHKYDFTKMGQAFKPMFNFMKDTLDTKGVLKTLGYLTVAKQVLNDVSLATNIVDNMMNIWDNDTRQLMTRLHRAIKGYFNNMCNDDYPGLWRMKIKTILGIERGPDKIATGVKIPHISAPNGLTVPFTNLLTDASQNALNAVYIARDFSNASVAIKTALTAEMLKTQAGINEMYSYYSKTLQLSLNVNDNEKQEYGYIKKRNLSLGIDQDLSQNTPYVNGKDILDNYEPVLVEIKNNLPSIVYDSGLCLADLFKDMQDFYMDKYVKTNYSSFKFDNSANAGLYKLDNSGSRVDQISVSNIINSKNIWRSDFQVLGRHYGYNVDGSMKLDEWIDWPTAVDENITSSIVYTKYEKSLKYTWSLDNSGSLVHFDYIHYQHYAMPKLADGSLNYSASAFNLMSDASKNITDVVEFNKWALQLDNEILLDYGKRSTYAAYSADYVNNKLSWYVLTNGVEKGLFTHEFIAQNGYFAFTNKYPDTVKYSRLSDYYQDPSNGLTQYCVIDGVDYVAKWSSVTVTIRANREQTSGVGSSSGKQSNSRKIYAVSQGYTTLNIRIEPLPLSYIWAYIHEGALGHGFDNIPGVTSTLIGIETIIPWTNSTTSNSIYVNKGTNYLALIPAGRAVISEGWATYSEFLAIVNNLYLNININGIVDSTAESLSAIIQGLSGSSRVAARQELDTGYHDPKFAYTFNRSSNRLYDVTKIDVNTPFFRQMNRLLVKTYGLQTTYAGGLIDNLAASSYLKKTIESNYGVGKFSMAKYVQFKITKGRCILGSALSTYVKENIDDFVMD